MGRISDELRKAHGMEVNVPEPSEHNEQTKAYWKTVKERKDNEQLITEAKDIWDNLPGFSSKGFFIDDQNREFVKTLCYYFARDPKFGTLKNDDYFKIEGKADLNKGLLIIGNCGLGKTYCIKTIYKLFQMVPGFTFGYISTNAIVQSFNKFGEDGILKYNDREFYFDDFGTEKEGSHFGKADVMQMIIERRYEKFADTGLKTHLSTNLIPSQIGERYGNRVESRLKEMFNVVAIQGNDRRK